MKTSVILNLLVKYILLGLKILIPIAIAFFIGYEIIYKKIKKGEKKISKKKLLLYAVSLCYIVIVIGATFLSRPTEEGLSTKEFNIHLFSSYREAYHNINVISYNNVLFRNIILNIILFIPLGFLVPFYSEKLKKVYKVVLIGLIATLSIEITQHMKNYGIFEMDDVFNNTLGTLIGYCIFMILLKLKQKEKLKNIIKYVIPIFLTLGTFAGIFIRYGMQEFGNLEYEYNYKINMKDVDVQSEVEFSKERSIKDIYHKRILNQSEARQIAENIFGKLGKTIDDNETEQFQNTINYWTTGRNSNNPACRIDISYNGGAYSYFDNSHMIIKNNTIEYVNEIENASREDVEKALQQLGIQIPQIAKFVQDRSEYIFSVDMECKDDKLIDGELTCIYYEDKTIKSIINNLITYNKVSEKEIKSEEEAYNEILDGKFMKWDKEEIRTIIIKKVQLDYQLDSKGYYVPVYVFETEINENKQRIFIKAIN